MKMLRLGLIARIALLVVGVEVAAFSALGWFYVDRFSKAIEERTYLHLGNVGRMIASDELAISSISHQSIVRDLVGAPYLNGMAIGGNGRIIVSTDPANLGRLARSVPGFDARWMAASAPDEEFISGENTLTAVTRIRGSSGGSLMYTTVITISTAELLAMKRSIALWGQLGSLLFILLSSAGIVLIAQRLITRRVNISLKVLKDVEDGALDARIPVLSNDELGQLQHGINSMTEKVGALLNQHRRNEEEIRASSRLLDSIVENIPNMIFLKRASDLRFVLFNKAGEKLLGFDRQDMLGKNDYDMFPKEQADFFTAHDRAVLRSPEVLDIPEETIAARDGAQRILHTQKLALHDSRGEAEYLLGISEDITERKKAEERISELAFFDQLTGLPNRTLLLDRLRQAMTTSARSGNYGALLFIDLDNFKTLNDTLGHDMGDLLLKQVARRLQQVVRAEDTVARVGGDEFLVMLTSLGANERESASQVEAVGRKILAALNQAYRLDDVVFNSTPSIGATLFRGQQASVDDLLKQADLAMYKSKEAGRNTLHFFNSEMERAVMERAALEKDLREAIQEKRFLLHYQAQVADNGRPTGAEVLLRWPHPQRGMVPPNDFIPLAEETGLILPLGHWVLHTACTQLAVWAARPEMSHLTVAVNVSLHQFRQPDFVDQVLAVVGETGANPHRLKLELTESMLASNIEDIVEKMHALKARGVGFSLDDFGTGYSSLSYLRRLPLDQLKIDQSFVRDVISNPNNATIAKTIVALARSLGLDVIAEGVETAAQRSFLAAAGCHAYQGYFFSHPLPLDDFEKFALEIA
ncbi:MAG: EAL domain-containing protein [Sulfuricellaceae bacterium]|nr:EAL domain-containing protein [Sulfuricellaceae bacterium]